MNSTWLIDDGGLAFSSEQNALIARIKDLLAHRMRDAAKRHRHSLGVARTAASLALAYDVDVFDAYVAGLVHDWDKVISDDEVLARALRYRVPIEGAPALAVPLLHGPVAACELPKLFPELSPAVFQAVARHTVAACDMTPLDMVVFIADALEPGRRGDYADRQRGLVGEVPLDELFFTCFSEGLVYVLESHRYLYPTAATIYNHYVLTKKGNA